MVLLLGQKDTNAAEVANKRACVAASFVGMLRGSEAALREEVAWDPAVHLTRADLYFEGRGATARAVIMTRAVRSMRTPTEYQSPRLGQSAHYDWYTDRSLSVRTQ